jgi:hypothetical protein
MIVLFIHLVATSALYWTKYDIIRVSTSDSLYSEAAERFNILVTFGLICIAVKGTYYGFNFDKISLAFFMHILCDSIGAFFVLWIVLDGWAWQSYAVVLVFCGYTLAMRLLFYKQKCNYSYGCCFIG